MKTSKKAKGNVFKFTPFSNKQMKVLTWWKHAAAKQHDAIICDGSVRAGKTLIMSLSYVMWAMSSFDDEQFGMAGKTIGSFRRNVLNPLKKMLRGRGYKVKEHRADNYIEISKGGVTNRFYIFGGKDEGSQDLIQGITLAGFFFDEAALMPRSFVNQATARCSVTGSKLWFNMNPAGPYHWFKMEWLNQTKEKNALHIHFTMDDNPSLSDEVRARYKRLYSGVFYQRYILGLWVMSEGLIFDNFDEETDIKRFGSKEEETNFVASMTNHYISIDYGTQNPTVFILWGLLGKTWYAIKEYYHSGRAAGRQKTDKQYCDDLVEFIGETKVQAIIVDPSAASFITQLRQARLLVRPARNEVLDGIRNTKTAMMNGTIKFFAGLTNLFREFHSYVWDEKAGQRGEDAPIKEHDHCTDACRYFVQTVAMRPMAKALSVR